MANQPTEAALQSYARQFRAHLRRAADDPRFLALLMRTQEIRSGKRVIEGALPLTAGAEAVLQQLLAAVKSARARPSTPAPRTLTLPGLRAKKGGK